MRIAASKSAAAISVKIENNRCARRQRAIRRAPRGALFRRSSAAFRHHEHTVAP
jgi:hypothetical protein